MRMNEIRERTDEELGRLAHQIESDLFKYRVQRHTSQLANPMLLRRSRKTLARIWTVVSARAQGRETAGAQQSAAVGVRPTPATPATPKAQQPVPPVRPKAAAAAAKPAKPTKAPPPKAKGAKTKEAKGSKGSKPVASPKAMKSAKGRSTRGGK